MSAPQGRAGAVELFLHRVLLDGAVAVDALEVQARAAGLLGQHQHIGDSKAFRRAKKGLRIRSVRTGFGVDGRWSWALPTASKTAAAETAADLPPEVPTSVVYAQNHSRPGRSGNTDQIPATGVVSTSIEPTPIRRVPLEWLTGAASLDKQRAPSGIPRHRWQLFLDDWARFLDPREAWAERAADLGWDAHALFGCHPTRPLDHLNGAGLLWRLSGGKIIAMQSDWALIEINGVQRIIHRRPSPANFVLPWRRRAP